MNKEGNVYTIIFASVMVVIVGGLLAFVASSLRPAQLGNVKNEKMTNVLQAIDPSFDGAELSLMNRKEVEALFSKHVKKRIILNAKGEVVSELTSEDPIEKGNEADAFNLDPRGQYAKISNIKKACGEDEECVTNKLMEQEIYAPMFICEVKGQEIYVAHFSGKGLWDDIWGYVGIKPTRKINAAVFDHKAETPGLGSKITEDWFQNQFQGKTMANDQDEYRPIMVKKPGLETNQYEVNGISGATFTGNGVAEMMARALKATHNYMEKNVKPVESPYQAEEVEKSLAITNENIEGFSVASGYSLQGDTLVWDNGTYGVVVYVDESRLLVKEEGKEFTTLYTK